MKQLESGAICTCDGGGGCAYHGTGDAGTYRKSFEHASANYTAERQRADELQQEIDRLHSTFASKINRIDEAINATATATHPAPAPWECPRCGRMNAPYAMQCNCKRIEQPRSPNLPVKEWA